MGFFSISGIGVISVLMVNSQWSQRRQLCISVAAFTLGLFFYITYNSALTIDLYTKGGSQTSSDGVWTDLWLYFAMISGMVAKQLFDSITKGKQPNFNKWEILKPILISPIVYGLIYAGGGDTPAGTFLTIYSFQNGFFWQTVLEKK